MVAFAALALPSGASAEPPAFWKSCESSTDEPPTSGAGQCRGPSGIGVDPSTPGNLYVADQQNNRIVELTAWGQFVRAWGWGVLDGAAELQICTTETGCQKGLKGSGAGQLSSPQGVAVDSAGNVHVVDWGNRRIQKFSPEGEFLAAYGGDVVAHGPGDSANDEVQELAIAASEGSFKLSFANPFPAGGKAQTASLPYNASAAEVEAALDALASVGAIGGSVSVTGGPGDPTGSSPYEISFEGDLGGDDVPRLELDRSTLGPASIGGTLRCASKAEAPIVEFSWLRNGVPIAGEQSPAYTTVAADEGKAIQCRVRTEVAEGGGAMQAANPVYVAPPVPATAPPVAPSQVELTMKFNEYLTVGGPGGQTLTCKPGSWQSAPSFAYEWYRNGTKIAGATSSTYVVTAADLASPAHFQCAAIGSNAGGATAKFSMSGVENASSLTPPGVTRPRPGDLLALRPKESMDPPSNVHTTNEGGAGEACSAAAGDVCKAGVEGDRPGFFGDWPASSFIAIDHKGTLGTDVDDVVYVGDTDRIQEFDAEGAYLGEIELPEAGTVGSLAVDQASGDLYFTYESPIVNDANQVTIAARPNVHRLDPDTGKSVGEPLEVGIPRAIATDAEGDVYVVDDVANGVCSCKEPGEHSTRVLVFDAAGNLLETVAETGFGDTGGSLPQEFDASRGIATGQACLSEGADLYLAGTLSGKNSFIRAWGPPPDDSACPPQRRAPSIEASYATSVGTEEAQLEALINPHFWSGAQGTTRYFVQYATAACVEPEPDVFEWEAPCVEEHPAAPGTALSGGVVDQALPAPVLLSGLEPATAYRFRFAAESKDPKGDPTVPDQPVIGVGGEPGEEGAERSFRTFAERAGSSGCPNDAFRTGPSAALPDCRAYELVSPVDKANGDVITQLTGLQGDLARLNQAAASGGALTYSSYRAFADPEGGAYSSQYIARRGAGGWSSENVSPPQEGPELVGLQGLATVFRHFSAELDESWIQTATDPPLASGAQERRMNIYRRESATGAFEACTIVAPPLTTSGVYLPVFQGASADGGVAVFRANDKLVDEATDETEAGPFGLQGVEQLYACTEAAGGGRELRLASVLPAGAASEEPSKAGAGAAHEYYGRNANLAGALSEDGSRLYWQSGGRLYLRTNPSEEQSPQEHGSAQGRGSLVGPALAVGDTNKGSKNIGEVEVEAGAFAVGQEVSGPCLAPETTLTAVEPDFKRLKIDTVPTATCAATEVVGHASDVLSNLKAEFGAFGPGQAIEGAGIAPATTVGALGPEGKSLTLSAPATQTRGGIGEGDLVGPALGEGQTSTASKTITQFKVKEAGFAVGQEVQGECLAAETKVTVLEIAAEKLHLSKEPTADCAGTEIVGLASNVIAKVSVAGGAFLLGEAIHGPGIPAGATITARTDTTLTISKPVEAGGTAVDVEIEAAVALESSSECSEEELACTAAVSPPGDNARFWAARPDGTAALFTQGGSLYRFEAAGGGVEQIAAGVQGLAGWSEDLSRAYFASTEVLAVGANPEGELPVEEELNLYLHEAGAGGGFAFLGTLAAGEGDSKFLSPINGSPNFRTARVTPDGRRLAFTTAARLTDYDNTDRSSGEPAAEVYLYDADEVELRCASCNPSGARPVARTLLRSRFADAEEAILAAAHIPPWINSFHATRALSEDGSRLYFNSTDALALGDINGHQDVYEWEQPGSGDCTEEKHSFSEQAGGCVELISSGRSGADSEFIDADRTGTDVFFATAQSLLPHDPGLVDIYDARASGGLDPPADPPPPCEGEACQSAPGAPEPITPASSLARGGGNVPSPPARRRCAKGKVRRRGRCVKAHRKRAAEHRKRAGRHRHQRSAGR